MDIANAYNEWSSQYDTNDNKTRDLEAIALRKTLPEIQFEKCLEIGCGTGKNTEWLLSKAERITAVDFSERMLERAKEKIQSGRVEFIQADITREWKFAAGKYDLVTFSLVLEHIENFDFIFKELSNVVRNDGYVYIGELHPYKQYGGTKARFETEEGERILTCFNHHISDFTQAALRNGLGIIDLNEFFDDEGRQTVPRVIAILLRKE